MSRDIEQRASELVSDFEMLENWMDRYQYLIELGRQLDDYPEDEREDADKVSGCQSQVWFQSRVEDGRLRFRAISDAAIVSGLIAVLLRLYDDVPPAQILAYEPSFVGALGLDRHLSPNRANGLFAMLERIRSDAAAAAA